MNLYLQHGSENKDEVNERVYLSNWLVAENWIQNNSLKAGFNR